MTEILPGELPVITGEKIVLRPITDGDTELIVRWRNDPAVYNNFIFREPLTPEMHRRWLETKVATGQVVQYIILLRPDLVPVGSVYFRDIDPAYDSAEYGVFIGEAEARGRGVGSETARLFSDFGLRELGLHRLALRVLEGNDAARRSYEKAGFKTEGVFRDMVKLDGKYRNVIFMARLKEED